jgi:hypothetical protein
MHRGFGFAAAVSLVAACGYRAGSFTGPNGRFAGEQATVGCLDVGVSSYASAEAEGPVIAYEFGNRCDRPTPVDLGAVIVRGRTESGREIELAPFDPDAELRPARLEARRTGREVIEYRAAVTDPIRQVCVELDRLAGHTGDRRAVCVSAGAP